MKPKIIIVLGPTATGKSNLAVQIAKDFNGEIVSADSRQVYIGLNIGAGKITKGEMKGIKHYMLDVASPQKRFSVVNFQKQTYKAIEEILKKRKMPILCGGTGFYIQSIVDGIILPEVFENKILRKKLEKESLESLQKKLKKLDSRRYQEVDINNKIRLIRAIEIISEIGKVPKIKKSPQYDCLQIGLKLDDANLTEKIHLRLLKRIKQGMIKEAENLHKKGLSWKRMEELGLEYKYLALYLQKKLNKTEMVFELETKIRQFAKRQMTWFKKDSRIKWFEPKDYTRIKKEISKFI